MPRRRRQGWRVLATLLTTSFQLLLSLANLSASIKDSPSVSQSARTLSIHLFLERPVGRVPLIWPYNSILGNLSGPICTTCSKYVSCLCFNTIRMSLTIPSSFFISMFCLLSLLATLRIRRRTAISKTWEFPFVVFFEHPGLGIVPQNWLEKCLI